MKVLIVEDELPAAQRLERLLRRRPEQVQVLAMLESIEDAVEWIQSHPAPELGFFDIQLADGLSFSIFERATVSFPVIFTTAYDQYALRAFGVNSIDYLLKPIEPEALGRAFRKWRQLSSPQPALSSDLLQSVAEMMRRPAYRERFLVRTGQHLRSIATRDIAYFYSSDKITWLRLSNGEKHHLEQTLEQLADLLDPRQFFRLNRQYLAGIKAIEKVTPYSNSRLRVHLTYTDESDRIIVSRDKVAPFKDWLAGE